MLGTALVEKLLRQDRRTHDRDASEAWQEFENFGEFYAAWKHQFIVGFSTPERLAARVIRIYVHRQLSAVVKHGEAAPAGGYEALDAALAEAIEANHDLLMAVLRERWPSEWTDIVQRNERPAGALV